MTRLLFPVAFLLGATAVIWMGSYFLGSDALALSVTALIGFVYTIGFIELVQYRRATATLATALSALPDREAAQQNSLSGWLADLHPSLQNAVRLRIEGERVGLPAPVMTPYLVGLLVMLGLLGTFVGMVETLKGAVFALEGTTELQAIRAGLAAPINGLSLAFGTSVAGVAASAMLGLISTLSRRERMLETRRLDDSIATHFRAFSLTHHRQETYSALQSQANALPEVSRRLDELAAKLEQMGDRLGDQLLANQASFHQSANATYSGLASSVGEALKQSLAESGRLAGESIKPALTEAVADIREQAAGTHRHVTENAEQQLTRLGDTFRAATDTLVASFDSNSSNWLQQQAAGDEARLAQWNEALQNTVDQGAAETTRHTEAFAAQLEQIQAGQRSAFESSTASFQAMSSALTEQWQDTGTQMNAFTAALGDQLTLLRKDEEARAQASAERLTSLEETVAAHLGRLGRELEEPMTRLIETASETPRAAADVIGKLREEVSNNMERDNKLLEDRLEVMAQLQQLATSLEQSSSSQREAIEQLVVTATDALQQASSGFAGQLDNGMESITSVADHFAASAVDMACLGEAFGHAVKLFDESNGQLIDRLKRIETTMESSTARSDEQMGYYVAQAREIIDQSLLSQKEVFEELRELQHRDEHIPAEAG